MSSEETTQKAILHWLHVIYEKETPAVLEELANRLSTRLERGGSTNPMPSHSPQSQWDEHTCVMISYADSITDGKRAPLACLAEFVETHLDDVIDSVHILPFFPSTSDDGFAVLDYRSVDPRLGSWRDVGSLSRSRRVMADVILNHGSRSSRLFKQFIDGEIPGKDFFLTVDDTFDVSNVVRPRAHPLIEGVVTANGTRKIWCTFSADQVDFDFSNPQVLEEFVNIILNFIDNGVGILRLDAVGFLWKESGTSCLNLPQTHGIIKLIRQIANLYRDDVIIVTETNLPNQENLSYFGNGNEAHWIYNFPLPPLVINSLLFADASSLRRWSMSMPPALEGTAYLNFLSSHDGFGMRPTEGLLSQQQRNNLLKRLEQNGSLFSWRSRPDGNKSVYEANTTLFTALKKTDKDPVGQYQIDRFIAAYTLIFAMEGIPAIFINSFIGAENDIDGVKLSGMNRRINRQKFQKSWTDECLNDERSKEAQILSGLKTLLRVRSKQPAFHPNATQFTLQLGESFFGVWRQSRDRRQSIFAITNLCATESSLNLTEINLINTESWYDLINGESLSAQQIQLMMKPYQTVWLSNR